MLVLSYGSRTKAEKETFMFQLLILIKQMNVYALCLPEDLLL